MTRARQIGAGCARSHKLQHIGRDQSRPEMTQLNAQCVEPPLGQRARRTRRQSQTCRQRQFPNASHTRACRHCVVQWEAMVGAAMGAIDGVMIGRSRADRSAECRGRSDTAAAFLHRRSGTRTRLRAGPAGERTAQRSGSFSLSPPGSTPARLCPVAANGARVAGLSPPALGQNGNNKSRYIKLKRKVVERISGASFKGTIAPLVRCQPSE